MNERRTLIELFERIHYEITQTRTTVPKRYRKVFDQIASRINESRLTPVAFFTVLIKWTMDTDKSSRAYNFYASETAVKIAKRIAVSEDKKQPQGGALALEKTRLIERLRSAQAQVDQWCGIYKGTNGYFTVMPMVDELYLALDFTYVDPSDRSLPISDEKREAISRWRDYFRHHPTEQIQLIQALRS